MNTFDRRLRAFSIDTAFAAVLVMSLIAFQSIPANIREYIVLGIYFGVFCLPYLFGKGQTFGKRIQKIAVVKNKPELVIKDIVIPNRFYLLLRELVKCLFILITFGVYIIIASIISTNRPDGRTIHDFIFKTRVIPLTKYVSNGIELNRGEAASKSLEGYGPNDY